MNKDTQTPARDAAPRTKKTFVQRLVAIRPSDLIAVFFLCVLAGLILAVFNVDPATLWVDFFGAVGEAWQRFFQIIADSLGWAVQYFFLGAVLVIPIWIAWRIIRAASDRKD